MATIRSLLRDRLTLRVCSVDRIYLQAYVPRLMSEGLLVRFLLDRGATIPSPALLGQIGSRFRIVRGVAPITRSLCARSRRRTGSDFRAFGCPSTMLRRMAFFRRRWSRLWRSRCGRSGSRSERTFLCSRFTIRFASQRTLPSSICCPAVASFSTSGRRPERRIPISSALCQTRPWSAPFASATA